MLQTIKNKLIENEHLPGVKKVSNWKLPSQDFAYGKKEQPDKEGVSLVTRSWNIHNPSNDFETPQNFLQLNKLAIKNKCFNFKTNLEFRKSTDLKHVLPKGKLNKEIFLPSEDFAYGIKYRQNTPIKNIVNYEFSNKAEESIRRSYSQMFCEREIYEKLSPKMTRYYLQKIDKKKNEKVLKEIEKTREPYKIKKFLNVESKLKENLKNFKTYLPNILNNKKSLSNDNLDYLINKVENEIKNIDKNTNYQ